MLQKLNQWIVILSILILTTTINSCKKNDVSIPRACFTADKTVLSAGDSVLFINCSTSDYAFLTITDLAAPGSFTIASHIFETSEYYHYQFNKAGKYIVRITAGNRANTGFAAMDEKQISVN